MPENALHLLLVQAVLVVQIGACRRCGAARAGRRLASGGIHLVDARGLEVIIEDPQEPVRHPHHAVRVRGARRATLGARARAAAAGASSRPGRPPDFRPFAEQRPHRELRPLQVDIRPGEVAHGVKTKAQPDHEQVDQEDVLPLALHAGFREPVQLDLLVGAVLPRTIHAHAQGSAYRASQRSGEQPLALVGSEAPPLAYDLSLEAFQAIQGIVWDEAATHGPA